MHLLSRDLHSGHSERCGNGDSGRLFLAAFKAKSAITSTLSTRVRSGPAAAVHVDSANLCFQRSGLES